MWLITISLNVYIVTEKQNQPDNINGVPLLEYSDCGIRDEEDSFLFVGVGDRYRDDIKNLLDKNNMFVDRRYYIEFLEGDCFEL